MKKLTATARNFSISINPEKGEIDPAETVAELILICAEKTYAVSSTGISQKFDVTTERIEIDIEVAKKLKEDLEEIIETLEKIHKSK